MTNSYIISIRGKRVHKSILNFIERFSVPLGEIESVFGFVEQSTLYGGRTFKRPAISEQDMEELKEKGIKLRLPLSNSFVSEEEYEQSRDFLDKYYDHGASLIITNDKFAAWVRRDYPDFELEASAIKNINTKEKVERAFELYDSIVLPANMNTKYDLLESFDNKERIILFGNAGCAFNCPSKICYPAISKINKNIEGAEFACSQRLISRTVETTTFDLKEFNDLGYHRFKMLRPAGRTCA